MDYHAEAVWLCRARPTGRPTAGLPGVAVRARGVRRPPTVQDYSKGDSVPVEPTSCGQCTVAAKMAAVQLADGWPLSGVSSGNRVRFRSDGWTEFARQ